MERGSGRIRARTVDRTSLVRSPDVRGAVPIGNEHPPGTFGELLRARRVRAGVTQQELAHRAELSVRGLRNLEHGLVRRPSGPALVRLVAALGLTDGERDRLLSMVAAAQAPGTGSGRVVTVGVLGPLQLWRGGLPLTVRSPMLLRLLGLLAIQPGELVSRDEIVDVLWGEHAPKTGFGLVRTYLGQLRGLIEPGRPGPGSGLAQGPIVTLRGSGCRLQLAGDRLDVARFDAVVAGAERARAGGDLDGAERLLYEALECWRGPALTGLGSRLVEHPAAVAAGRRRVRAALAHADTAVRLGRPARAAAALRVVAQDEPLDEAVHARLIATLVAAGQQASAVRLYGLLRARLRDELGVEPGAEVRAAYLAAVRDDTRPAVTVRPAPAAGPAEAAEPGESAGPAVPAQLPADVPGFTGRGDYLDRLDSLARGGASPAVVITTVAGSAGVGKTALAVHWAHLVADRFADGQLYVNLRGYASGPPLRPIDALARFLVALGVPTDQVPPEVDAAAGLYRSLLAGKRVLVLLDNARHPDQVRPLLPAGPGCLVVVTSRDRLGGLVARDGAARIDLDALTPAESGTLLAGLLGAGRASAAPAAVADIARLCGHLPLALRIVAANLAARPRLALADYAARLAGDDRLATLAVDGDPEAAVRTAFDRSYAALPPAARRLFRLLGLVPGPDVTADAAAALAGIAPGQAATLVDRLAAAYLVDEPAQGRYALHDLLRLYAAQRAAAEETEVARRAAVGRLYDFYLRRVDAAAGRLYPHMVRLPLPAPAPGVEPSGFDGHEPASAWLAAERANLVAAITHAADHGPRPAAARLADAVRGYLYLRMHVVDWLAVATAAVTCARAQAEPTLRAAAHLNLAAYLFLQSRWARATDHYTEALTLARIGGWGLGESTALGGLALLHGNAGRHGAAVEHLTAALVVGGRIGHLGEQARNLANLGLLYVHIGRLADAADHLTQSVAVFRRAGSRGGEATALRCLARAYRALGRLDDAHAALTEALAVHRELGYRNSEGDVLSTLAAVLRDAGRAAEALGPAEAAVTLGREIRDQRIEVEALTTLASVQHHLGRHRPAIEVNRQALEVARGAGHTYNEADALVGLAAARLGAGDPDRAVQDARLALELAGDRGYRVLEGQALTALAAGHIDLGEPGQAVDLAGQAAAIQAETGHRLGLARSHLAAAAGLSALGDAAAAGERRDRAAAEFTAIGAPMAEHARATLGPATAQRWASSAAGR